MKFSVPIRKLLGSTLLALFTLMSVQAPALADMISTDQLAMEQRSDSQRAVLTDFLSREDVRAQLEARGVDAADAQQRIDSLTATELAALHEQIDTLPAGEGLGIVISIIVIFMLLDIAGVTDIFPGI